MAVHITYISVCWMHIRYLSLRITCNQNMLLEFSSRLSILLNKNIMHFCSAKYLHLNEQFVVRQNILPLSGTPHFSRISQEGMETHISSAEYVLLTKYTSVQQNISPLSDAPLCSRASHF